ncbi:uncharacterized protein Dwil_GK20623 [Drosophila willistoni]|uniref:Uncharacterized protein n=1 Tax=Drosophila willistoni TaxID=7260 RepID=B4MKG5_DROWI|nr:uncharacterized protein CG13380 [Drosophila willistoni]EDW72604.1 uncharacterized protein Dwil_GK20623 [Drosophila willistoni]
MSNTDKLDSTSGGPCSGSRPTENKNKSKSQPLGNRNRNMKSSFGLSVTKKEGDTSSKDENGCICYRKKKAYECGRCHQYFYGRVCEICPIHKEIFLMDFQRCPYCAAPIEQIKDAPMSWDEIRKMEDAELPNADEGL